MSAKMIFRTGSVVAVTLAATSGANAQQANMVQQDGNTIFTLPKVSEMARGATGPDFVNAKPMPLPRPKSLPAEALRGVNAIQSDQSWGAPGLSTGEQGNGKTSPKTIPAPRTMAPEAEEVVAGSATGGEMPLRAFGAGGAPYNTSRVDISGAQPSGWHPYRATGKLYFKNGGSTAMCSASLIKRGVIVTAAHCVAEFGKKRLYSDFQFIPALSGSTVPYGVWKGEKVVVKSSYLDGTDVCGQGVFCANDVAVIRLQPQSSDFPGTKTGWYGYGYNNWGFINGATLISQLGYPFSHDKGLMMQRTDSMGVVSASMSNNIIWGSGQTGGSSGGPELANLGISPMLSGTSPGSYSTPNVVIGVTSWGYQDTAMKIQGASPFTANNIVSLVKSVCGTPLVPACK